MTIKQCGPITIEIPDWNREKVKKLREQSGLTQFAFAVKYDIPIYTIQAWEAGKRTPDTDSCLALEAISNHIQGITGPISITAEWVEAKSKNKGFEIG